MKKRLLSIILMALMLMTSCSKPTTDHVTTDDGTDAYEETVYEIELASNVEAGMKLIKNAPCTTRKEGIIRAQSGDKVSVKIGKKELELKYTEYVDYEEGNNRNYTDEAGIKYTTLNDDSNLFAISALDASDKDEERVIIKYTDEELTEQNLLKNAKEYLAQFVPDIDYSAYTYTCRTVLYESGPDYYAGLGVNEGFIVPENDPNSEVQTNATIYLLEFWKYERGGKTADRILFRAHGNGDIHTVAYRDYGVDWSQYNIEQSIVDKSAECFVNKYLGEGCTMQSCEAEVVGLSCGANKDVIVSVLLTVTGLYEGESITEEYELFLYPSKTITYSHKGA